MAAHMSIIPAASGIYDLFGSKLAWTPPMTRLYSWLVEMMSSGVPGGYVWAPTGVGKSKAIIRILEDLPTVIGPVARMYFEVPTWNDQGISGKSDDQKTLKKTELLASILKQCGSQRRKSRYLDLDDELIDHIVDLAEMERAKRFIFVVDNAHNLEPSHQQGLIALMSRLESQGRGLKPFHLLVSQAHVGRVFDDVQAVQRSHIFRRVYTREFRYDGVALDEIKLVLELIDEGLSDSDSGVPYLAEAYATGFRLANLAEPLCEALRTLWRTANLPSTLRLPMDFLMSSVLWVLSALVKGTLEHHQVNVTTFLTALERVGYVTFMPVHAELERYGQR